MPVNESILVVAEKSTSLDLYVTGELKGQIAPTPDTASLLRRLVMSSALRFPGKLSGQNS